jgi:hypothetical protein
VFLTGAAATVENAKNQLFIKPSSRKKILLPILLFA